MYIGFMLCKYMFHAKKTCFMLYKYIYVYVCYINTDSCENFEAS